MLLSRKAYTMLEILIVIFIISCLMFIGLPRFTDLQSSRSEKAALELTYQFLKTAQQMAKYKRMEYAIIFHPERNALAMVTMVSGQYEFEKDWVFLPSGIHFQASTLPLQKVLVNNLDGQKVLYPAVQFNGNGKSLQEEHLGFEPDIRKSEVHIEDGYGIEVQDKVG